MKAFVVNENVRFKYSVGENSEINNNVCENKQIRDTSVSQELSVCVSCYIDSCVFTCYPAYISVSTLWAVLRLR